MDYICTSDGRVSFKKEGYIAHNVGNIKNIYLHENEMEVIHRNGKDGKLYFTFPNEESAIKASKEISEQLNK